MWNLWYPKLMMEGSHWIKKVGARNSVEDLDLLSNLIISSRTGAMGIVTAHVPVSCVECVILKDKREII